VTISLGRNAAAPLDSQFQYDFTFVSLDRIAEIDGTGGPDIIIGSAGNDVIIGAGGNDGLDGGEGDDKLVGGIGDDRLFGSLGNDTLIGGPGNDWLNGGEGSDTYYVSPGDGTDTFADSGLDPGLDRILSTNDSTVISLSSDSFGILGHLVGIEEISADGHSGVTISLGRDPAISLDFQYQYDFTFVSLDGIAEIDGSAGDDTITGSAGNDVIVGAGGDDVLDGGNGDDKLVGGIGNDSLIGGSGFDTAVFSGAVRDYLINVTDAATGQAIVQDLQAVIDGDDGIDLLATIEAIKFKDYTVYLDGTNNAVLAVDDAINAVQQVSSTISASSLLANDFDFDHDALSLEAVSNAQHGTVELNASGDVIFTPAADFTGIASFDYVVSDGHGSVDTGTVSVRVAAEFPPDARDDAASTDQNTVLIGPSVLANDSDPDASDSLTVSAVNGLAGNVESVVVLASGAHLTVHPDGTYSYDPHGKFTALGVGASKGDQFTYTVSDGHGSTSDATVTITITGLNDGPVALDDSASTDQNTILDGASVLANDSDPDTGDSLNVSAVDGVAGNVGNPINLNSGARLIMRSDGTYSYDPNGKFTDLGVGASRTDQFNYSASDGHGGTVDATVTITISGLNDGPVAQNDSGSSPVGTLLSGSVLTNDSDPDAGETATLVVSAVNGTAADLGTQLTLASGALLKINENGSYTYDTTNAVAGGPADTITYTVSDAHGSTADATLSLTVTPHVDTPLVADDFVVTNIELFFPTPIPEWALLYNDTPDAGALQISKVTKASGGTLDLFTPTNAPVDPYSDPDIVVFTETAAAGGLFAYQATDGVASATGVVTVETQPDTVITGTRADEILIADTNNVTTLLDGKGGNDILIYNSTQTVALRGGPGDDVIVGPDIYGPTATIAFSNAVIDFSDATGAIDFTLDQSPGPHAFKAPGLGSDTYYNIRGVVGTSFDDTLRSDGYNNGEYFDISSGGNDTVIGTGTPGPISNTIYAGGAFTADDRIQGGTSTGPFGNQDTLVLDGDYSGGVVFNPTTLTSVEQIKLMAGHSYSLTTDDATVAPGGIGLGVDASRLGSADTLTLDARAEQDGEVDVTGGSGNDTFFGGAFRDSFSGGAGDDTFYANAAVQIDQFSGGAGSDQLVIGSGTSGAIGFYNFFDFQPHAGGNPEADTILLQLGSDFSSFQDILDAMSEQPGFFDPTETDTVITFVGDGELRIWNTHIADFTAKDFGF
jgi:VCBS repeat-containing protein